MAAAKSAAFLRLTGSRSSAAYRPIYRQNRLMHIKALIGTAV
jgi:hypothetical protein